MSMKEDNEYFLDEHCRHILFLLLLHERSEPKKAMRFNELGRQLVKWGFKMSDPTLIQHLNELQKRKVVQRVERSRNDVAYYIPLSFLKAFVPRERILNEWKRIEDIQKASTQKSLSEIVSFLLAMQSRRDLWVMKSYLKSQFEPRLRDRASIEHDVINENYRYLFMIIASQIHDKKSEYEDVMKELDIRIKKEYELGGSE